MRFSRSAKGAGAQNDENRGPGTERSRQLSQVSYIPLSRVVVMQQQLRRHRDDASFRELVTSIQASGILQPLLVRPLATGFGLVCGHRRYTAAKELGLQQVPVLVCSILEEEVFLVGLQENIHREAMNPIEEAEAYRVLLTSGIVRSQAVLASRVGVSEARISRVLALLELPDQVRELFFPRGNDAGSPLTERHARVLRQLSNTERQIELARRAVMESLSIERLQALATSSRRRFEGVRRARVRQKSWIAHGGARYRSCRKGFLIEIRARDSAKLRDSLRELLQHLEKDSQGTIG